MPYHASGDTCQQANASDNDAGLTGTYRDRSKDMVGTPLTARRPHSDGETGTCMQTREDAGCHSQLQTAHLQVHAPSPQAPGRGRGWPMAGEGRRGNRLS